MTSADVNGSASQHDVIWRYSMTSRGHTGESKLYDMLLVSEGLVIWSPWGYFMDNKVPKFDSPFHLEFRGCNVYDVIEFPLQGDDFFLDHYHR